MDKTVPETLVSLVRRDLSTKLVQGVLTGAICGAIYHGLQQAHVFQIHLRTDCLSWRLIPFQDFWIWPYASMMLMVGLAWITLPTEAAVYRFRRYLISVSLVGWIFFLFYPTVCSRAGIISHSQLYRWLILADAPTNCFPCLHAALSVLAAVLLIDRATALKRFVSRAGIVVWTVAILVSIVALRQHTGVDVLAGTCLGTIAGVFYIKRNPLYVSRSMRAVQSSHAKGEMRLASKASRLQPTGQR